MCHCWQMKETQVYIKHCHNVSLFSFSLGPLTQERLPTGATVTTGERDEARCLHRCLSPAPLPPPLPLLPLRPPLVLLFPHLHHWWSGTGTTKPVSSTCMCLFFFSENKTSFNHIDHVSLDSQPIASQAAAATLKVSAHQGGHRPAAREAPPPKWWTTFLSCSANSACLNTSMSLNSKR